MTPRKSPETGSRFLYDSFDAASARIEANERVAEERWAALDFRLGQIDAVLERLEKRIWLGVFGAVGVELLDHPDGLMQQRLQRLWRRAHLRRGCSWSRKRQ